MDALAGGRAFDGDDEHFPTVTGGTDTPFVADAPAAQRARAIREIPMRREARPEEMAPAALFLLSDRLAGYITGTELIVDGGLRHRPIFGGSDDDLAALNT
jgi:NAD(P)-dependent dehydrogenase (short-subunit alcohol dehydrogenase family)